MPTFPMNIFKSIIIRHHIMPIFSDSPALTSMEMDLGNPPKFILLLQNSLPLIHIFVIIYPYTYWKTSIFAYDKATQEKWEMCLKYWKSSHTRGLVKIRPTCLFVQIYSNLIIWVETYSLIKWCFMGICLAFECRRRFLNMMIALVLS